MIEKNTLLNEIQFRLRNGRKASKQVAALARALRINPEGEPSEGDLEPLRLPLAEGELIKGEIPFELNLSMFGQSVTCQCRVAYLATLFDDEDRKTGQPIRILGEITTSFQVLDWQDHYGADWNGRLTVPVWNEVQIFNLIPAELLHHIDELVEADAIAREKSNTIS